MHRLAALALILALAGCAAAPSYRDTAVPISSAAAFDPVKYQGLWYEIARFPVPFQTGCTRVTARYDLKSDGSLGVVNSCRIDGNLRRIEGTAQVTGPGRLSVSFSSVPFAKSPYWVLWVDESYRTAVVGVPSGRAGWILNRDPVIPPDRWQAALDVLEFNGYDLRDLVPTPQG